MRKGKSYHKKHQAIVDDYDNQKSKHLDKLATKMLNQTQVECFANVICLTPNEKDNVNLSKKNQMIFDDPIELRNKHAILIQWCVVGKYMPRKAMMGGNDARSWNSTIDPGSVVWHEFGDWFEVVK